MSIAHVQLSWEASEPLFSLFDYERNLATFSPSLVQEISSVSPSNASKLSQPQPVSLHGLMVQEDVEEFMKHVDGVRRGASFSFAVNMRVASVEIVYRLYVDKVAADSGQKLLSCLWVKTPPPSARTKP